MEARWRTQREVGPRSTGAAPSFSHFKGTLSAISFGRMGCSMSTPGRSGQESLRSSSTRNPHLASSCGSIQSKRRANKDSF